MAGDEASADESNLTADQVEAAEGRTEASAGSPGQIGERESQRECMPCHGTGSVVSHLGGERSQLPCPWCGGTGVRRADMNAQAKWLHGEDVSVHGENLSAGSGETAASQG
jgi:DnaJ-class molecular chaperone